MSRDPVDRRFYNSEIEATWDSILEEMRHNDEMSKVEFSKLKHSFSVLATHLGENFPQRSLNQAHPLMFSLVGNNAAFAKKWFIWFGEAVELLCKHENFSELKGKLITGDFSEGLDFVRVCYRFARAGWKIMFEPELCTKKKPDILFETTSGKKLLAEITSLGESDKDKEAFRQMMRIVDSISSVRPDFYYSTRIQGYQTTDGMNRIEDAITSFISELRERKAFTSFVDSEHVVIAGASDSCDPAFTEFLASHEMELNSVRHTDSSGKDFLLGRLKKKLAKKAEQVSSSGIPSIIAIHCNEFTTAAAYIDTRVAQIVDYLRDFPEVLGVIIIGTMLSEPSFEVFVLPTHIFLELRGARFEQERWILIPNKLADFDFSNTALFNEIFQGLLESVEDKNKLNVRVASLILDKGKGGD